MDGMQWFIIILLVVLIAVFAFMFLRKPSSGREGVAPSSPDQDHTHDHAATGGATAMTGQVFDQEAHREEAVDTATPADDVTPNRLDGTRGENPDALFAEGSDEAPYADASARSDIGSPGAGSQAEGEAVYDSGEVGPDSPGPESSTADQGVSSDHLDESGRTKPETAPDPTSAGQGSPGASAAASVPETWEDHDDVPSNASAAGFGAPTRQDEPVSPDRPVGEDPADAPPPTAESPYGPGSALADEEGNGPQGWPVKGNAGSMLFHTPDSPRYASSRAEVWFVDEQAARDAGFAHWDRKQR